MRVYVSVDMEGIAGVATLDQVIRGGSGYLRAQELMTAETNAVIAGAFDAGADEVLVNDSHGTMDNLLHESMDERARLIFGTPKAQCMAHGLDGDHDVAMLVGYHAPAGVSGVLSHTFSSFFTGFRVNGACASEADVTALAAGAHRVPVGLVTGDDVICALAEEQLPGAVTVAVKRAEGNTATNSLHPAAARAQLREAAARAVATADRLTPVPMPDALVLEVDFQIAGAAEVASQVPGAERVGHLGVRRELADPDELMGLVNVWYQIAAGAARTQLGLMQRV
ncbi:M55 family metallopeptidase [Actinomycetes bacterium KLBMP 9759]